VLWGWNGASGGFLGLGHRANARAAEELASVRKIVDALDSMDPAAACFLARFAYVLGRAWRAPT
jgi:hypothetical protein